MKTPLHIGIVGSRRRTSLSHKRFVIRIVSNCVFGFPDREIVIVSGGCPKGADKFAEDVASFLKLRTIVHPVMKQGDSPIEHRGDFRKRAYARNELIAIDSEILFALCHNDRTGGTENTIEHALRLRKKVFLVGDDGLLYLQPGVREEKTDASRDASGPVQQREQEDDAS